MADRKKLSEASAASALTGVELLYCVQGGVTKYATPLQVRAYVVAVLAAVAASGSASDLGSGTLASARLPALTGDITSSAGSAATTLATVNANVGTFFAPTITVDAKGRITAAATPTTQTLTDAATVAWDVSLGAVAKVTLADNRTLGAPTNLVDGGTYILRVIQDGTGGRTLAFNAVYKFPGGTDPTLSTAAGAIDVLSFVSDGTNLYGVAQLAFA